MRGILLSAGAVLASVAAVAGVGVATSGTAGEKPGETFRAVLEGQDVRLAVPTGGTPKGLAIWFHGQGGGANAHFADPILIALYRDGWAVASSDFHDASWGNAASTADTERLISWAEQKTGVPATLWVAGSMGGTVSLNAMNHGAPTPTCWYGVHPATSLTHMQNVPGGDRNIRIAYGGAPPADRDPVRNVSRLPAGVRYRVVASPDDPLVSFRQNIAPLVRGLRSRGIEITTRLVTGDHEDPSHWSTGDLVSFASACTESTTQQAQASD